MKNLRVFRELCGEEAMSGVVLATTMWEGVSADKGVSREDELKDKFWAGMIRKGSRVMRQDQGATSARAILESIMERRQRMPLALQAEMAANVDFNETGAGRALQADMATQMRRFQAEIRELQQQLAEARQGGDIDTWKELAKARAEDVAELRRLNEDYQKLNVTAQELRDQELAREREAHSRELAHLAKVHELDLRLQAERESGRNPISHTVRWFFRLFK